MVDMVVTMHHHLAVMVETLIMLKMLFLHLQAIVGGLLHILHHMVLHLVAMMEATEVVHGIWVGDMVVLQLKLLLK